MSNEEFQWSEEPIQTGCECYTCQNYTLSYLYHLYEVKEMNANILTAIHNAKVYDDFFGKLKDVDSMADFVAWMILDG